MKLLVLVLALGLIAPASAAVYKTVRPDGSVTYSDQPPRDETAPHALPSLQMVPAENLAPAAPARQAASDSSPPSALYHSLAITQPEQNGTVRDTAGRVTVQVALDPPLDTKQGDYLIVYLDGQPAVQGGATSFTLDNIDRGTHTVEASVSSGPGHSLIRSAPVTFHVHRTTVNRPAR